MKNQHLKELAQFRLSNINGMDKLVADRDRRIAELESWVRGVEEAMISATDHAAAAERERDELKHIQELNVKTKQAMNERFKRAERERDEFKALAEGQSELAGRNAARAQKAEAEIARRDAAASKPVAWISERNLKILGKAFSVVVKHEPVMVRPVALYTSAPPAVLPPEKITEIMQDSWNEFCDDTGCYPDDFEYQNEQLFFDAGRWAMLVAERISSLGAQPQKPAPDGWKLVPVIPTWGMLSSDGCSKHHNGQECSHHENRKRI